MNDIFTSSSTRRGYLDELDTGLSKSVDFSRLTSVRDCTPPRTRSQSRLLEAPPAPRKPSRKAISRSLPTSVEELPKPRRLFDPVSHLSSGSEVDYSAVMSIVGFISSFIARHKERKFPLVKLVELISSVSINHRSPVSALAVLRSLAKAVPEWVSVEKQEDSREEMFVFSSGLKTFDVLSKLRDLKRERLMGAIVPAAMASE